MPARGQLISFEAIQVDKIYGDTFHVGGHPHGITFGKVDAGSRAEDIDPAGRITKLDDLAGFEKIFFRLSKLAETELLQGFQNALRIFGAVGDPDVYVLGVARMPVKRYGIAADHQVSDAVIV
jgi:hypothetical protein